MHDWSARRTSNLMDKGQDGVACFGGVGQDGPVVRHTGSMAGLASPGPCMYALLRQCHNEAAAIWPLWLTSGTMRSRNAAGMSGCTYSRPSSPITGSHTAHAKHSELVEAVARPARKQQQRASDSTLGHQRHHFSGTRQDQQFSGAGAPYTRSGLCSRSLCATRTTVWRIDSDPM